MINEDWSVEFFQQKATALKETLPGAIESSGIQSTSMIDNL